MLSAHIVFKLHLSQILGLDWALSLGLELTLFRRGHSFLDLSFRDGLLLNFDFLAGYFHIFFLAHKSPLVAKPARGEVLADRVSNFVAVEFATVFFLPKACDFRNPSSRRP